MNQTIDYEIAPTVFDKGELLRAIRFDCVTFFAFYLQDELELEVPELHVDIWDELLQYLKEMNRPGLIGVLKKLFAVPREHAKSTIAKLAVILFLKFSPLRFCLYVSKTNGNAKNAIRDIVKWLKSPQERELYGELVEVKSSETESLWIYDMPTIDLDTMRVRYKRIIFRALGSKQQIRGLLIDNRRPELVIMDDIEDRDNTTDELQPELDAWVMGSLIKSFARRAFVLFIGNMIRETTLLARLTKESDWHPTVFGSLVLNKQTGELAALWPGRWTVEALLEEYAAFRRLGTGHVWEAEMLNLTQDQIFGESLGEYVSPPMPMPEDLLEACLILDPAGFGEKPTASSADSSAITVHARIENVGVPCCIDSWEGKASEDMIFDRMIEYSLKWGISVWFIESVAAQRLFISYFKLLMKDRLMNHSLIQIYPIIGGRTTKAARIQASRSSVKSRSYGIVESEAVLAGRLAKWSPGQKHEDLEDSFAFGLIAWETNSMNMANTRNAPLTMAALYSDSMADLTPQYNILDY